jgi:hypothetical protein
VPQPYEQLAAVYQQQGQDADARAVLVAKHRSMRRTLSPAARLWSVLQDATVGYGYRPLRAVWLLLGLLTAGTALFAAWPPTAVGDGKPPPFQPALYTLDLLLPLVDLGQETFLRPNGHPAVVRRRADWHGLAPDYDCRGRCEQGAAPGIESVSASAHSCQGRTLRLTG